MSASDDNAAGSSGAHRDRLLELKRALEAARAVPSPANLSAPSLLAIKTLRFAGDLDERASRPRV